MVSRKKEKQGPVHGRNYSFTKKAIKRRAKKRGEK